MRHGPRPRLAQGLLIASLAVVTPTGQAADAAFAKAYAGSDKRQLTEWGRRFQHGEGVARDLDSAIRLYCKAARAGDIDAQYYLGYLYANGSGVKRDEELAAAWLHLAAARQDPQSKRILAMLGFLKKPRRQPVCALTDGRDALRPPPRPYGPALALGPTRTQTARGAIPELVRRLAAEYQLDPNLVLALIEVESNFDPQARSPKNAQGLMQLIPATAARFGVRNVWDPEQNLRGGMAYLRWLLAHFKGDVRLALAGYNAGEGAVAEHGGVPPYDETRTYVARIMRKLAP